MNSTKTDIYSLPEYKRTRKAYIAECTFEYFVALLVADAYLSSLLHHMGISDAMIGIMSSLISFSFLFQLFAVIAVRHIVNVKRAAIIFHFSSQIFFMSLYFIPFLPFAREFRTVIVFACILIAYFGNYLVTSTIYKWGMSFVDTHKRASFSASKEMVSLVSGIVFSLITGFAVDKFSESGNIEGGFIFIGVCILVSSLFDLVSLILMKNQKFEKNTVGQEPMTVVVKKLFSNKGFICLLFANILWYIGLYMTNSFMGIYKTSPDELNFTVGQVQIMNIVGCFFRFALSKPIGKFSDKTSYVSGIMVGACMAAACFAANIFTSPSSRWVIYIYTLLYYGSLAATTQNFMNITFDIVGNKYFVQASSIKMALSGLCGFGASLVGSLILSAIQKNGNRLFGIEIRGQQFLSVISCIIMLTLALFVNFVLKKQKKVVDISE